MADRSFGNYSSCCRLCLSESSDSLKSVFDNGTASRPLNEQIQASMGIEIKESDKLSTMVCEQCSMKLDQWNQFKNLCLENQKTLESWMNNWDSHQIANVSLQIKDESVDEESAEPVQMVTIDERGGRIKEEPMETDHCRMDDTYEDLPPPLTPHPPDERMTFDMEDEGSLSNATALSNGETVNHTITDSRNCTICDKSFSTVGNRKKHERMIHGKKDRTSGIEEDGNQSSGACTEDESGSVHSSIPDINKMNSKSVSSTPSIIDESDQQKIQFAAKLKLQLQHHASPSPNHFTFNGFTKVETSYVEKCKAMIKMNETFICVCHNEQHQSFKQNLQHIRKNPIWFPCYTCFNCMITFTDRSTYMKHYVSCPKEKLQNLKRLGDTKENTEMKVRLYQVYMCTICNFIFSYHEDFCQHVNTVHIGEPDQTECKKCGTTFETVDAVRRHVYLSSCIMNYRCDVCWRNFGSMTEFKVHCEQEHDHSEGFSLEYNDNFRKRSSAFAEINRRSEEMRRRSHDAPRLEPENADMNPEPHKVLNPHAFINSGMNNKNRRSACHICGKVYSNYHNMMRHAKTHDESLNTFKCSHCPETFRLTMQLRQHEHEVHNANNSLDQSKAGSRITREFRFTCPECGSSFRDLGEFMKHKETHKLPCDECGKLFDTQNELDHHRSAHLNIKLYRDSKTHNYKSSMVSAMLMCEVCDKVFGSKNELCQHKLLHEQMPVLTAQDLSQEDNKDNTKKYTCNLCNKSYLGYGGLWDHNNKHHPGRKIPREYPRQCNYCDKMLFTGGSWYMHKQMHERLAQQALNVNNSNRVSDFKVTHPKKSNRDSEDAESYHTCKKCFKVFSSKYNLRNHMKCHGINTSPASRTQAKLGKQSKTYWCDVCHQACQGFSELQRHKQEHVEEGMPQLNSEADTEEPKKLHIFLCDICDKDFTTKFALKKHKERHDLECSPIQKKRYFYCKYCKIPFKNMTILEEHMQGEHNESVMPKSNSNPDPIPSKHPCGICKKVFDTASALSSHQGWHKRGKVEKQMRTQEKLFRKMVNQMPKQEIKTEIFQCFICLLQFPNETALQIHILEAHRSVDANQPIPRCDSCNLDFDTQLAYEKHLQLHKVVEQQKSQPIVHNSDTSPGKEVHKIVKNHPCKYCPSAFTRSDTLNAHMKEKHREYVQTVFSCTQCDRVFEKQNALSTHLKVHERQKQAVGPEKSLDKLPKKFYSCSICHVGFQIAKDLRNHIISTHPF